MVGVRKVLHGVSALTVGVVLAVCSGATGSVSASMPKGTPITVGVICTCSGSFGALPQSQLNVYKLIINSLNSSGGINGHRVDLITENDAATPGTSVSEVQSLVSDHVDAILDLSFVDVTWASTIGSSGIPIVGGNLTSTTFGTYPDFYPQGQTPNSVAEAVALTAKKAGAANMALVYCTEAPACKATADDTETAGQSIGLSTAYIEGVSLSEPNYTAQCVAAKQANAAAMFAQLVPGPQETFATNCAEQDYDPIYIVEGSGLNLPAVLSTPGLKRYTISPVMDRPSFSSAPEVKKMDAAVDKSYPGLRKTTGWTELVASVWSAGLLLQAAVKAGGLTSTEKPRSAEIVKGLESLKNNTLGGMAPPLTFVAGKPHSINCWFTAKVRNGVVSEENGGHATCAKS